MARGWLDSIFGGASDSGANAAAEQPVDWSTAVVPSGLDSVFTEATYALNEALAGTDGGRKMLSVDILTPGLSPRLEQKAALLQEYLFDSIIRALLPALTAHYGKTMLCFQSIGDAASFRKHVTQNRIDLRQGRDDIILGDVDVERITGDVECCVFVTTKQHIGDPVLQELEKISTTFPRLDMVFYNCDLSDKVTTGIQARAARDSYRSMIKPAFYFRNLVEVSRPSLVPSEVGAMVYTPTSGWCIYAAMVEDVSGPGSLNRFMLQGVFKRSREDCSAARPPRFARLGSFESMPRGEELQRCLAKGEFLQRRR